MLALILMLMVVGRLVAGEEAVDEDEDDEDEGDRTADDDLAGEKTAFSQHSSTCPLEVAWLGDLALLYSIKLASPTLTAC